MKKENKTKIYIFKEEYNKLIEYLLHAVSVKENLKIIDKSPTYN